MACGGCADRRRYIVAAATAIASGDVEEAKRQADAFQASLKTDAARLTRAAKSRLGMGSRR